MEINPYLGFNGQCEEAFKFYEKVLGGKIEGIMTYGSSPIAAQMPPGNARQNHPRTDARWRSSPDGRRCATPELPAGSRLQRLHQPERAG